jgi:hypothetical protein
LNARSNEPVATLAPVPIQDLARAVFVAVDVVNWPSTSRLMLRNDASDQTVELFVAVAVTPPAPVVVTLVGEPFPASVPTKVATVDVSVVVTFASPMPIPRLTPVKEFEAFGVSVPVAVSASEPAVTVAPSPTEARVAPAVLALMLAMFTDTPLTLTA